YRWYKTNIGQFLKESVLKPNGSWDSSQQIGLSRRGNALEPYPWETQVIPALGRFPGHAVDSIPAALLVPLRLNPLSALCYTRTLSCHKSLMEMPFEAGSSKV